MQAIAQRLGLISAIERLVPQVRLAERVSIQFQPGMHIVSGIAMIHAEPQFGMHATTP